MTLNDVMALILRYLVVSEAHCVNVVDTAIIMDNI